MNKKGILFFPEGLAMVILFGLVTTGSYMEFEGKWGKCGSNKVDSAITHYNIDTMEKTYTIFSECAVPAGEMTTNRKPKERVVPLPI